MGQWPHEQVSMRVTQLIMVLCVMTAGCGGRHVSRETDADVPVVTDADLERHGDADSHIPLGPVDCDDVIDHELSTRDTLEFRTDVDGRYVWFVGARAEGGASGLQRRHLPLAVPHRRPGVDASTGVRSVP